MGFKQQSEVCHYHKCVKCFLNNKMDQRFGIIQREMLCSASELDYVNVVHLKWFKGHWKREERICIITLNK